MVYYRKYRPQLIDELDTASVRETLLSLFSKPETIPHAFLFTGPKGLGKTSTARIIAKVVNCERKLKVESGKLKIKGKRVESVEPCNECHQCISITNGTNMDILEIDAASNRGIDEIRDLKEKIRLAPLSAKKKVYIIDEVHMLTTEAFNALLKTLEEPPDHAMFVLCTTEPHKIPSTILSRCFHIAFDRASSEELVRSFRRIVKEEKIQIDDEALQKIAQLSDAGFRDGVKILEEVVSLSKGRKITQEFIEGKYKVSGIEHQANQMLGALIKRDVKDGLQICGKLVEQGADMKYFLQQLMEMLHRMLLVKAGIQNQESRIKNQELRIEEIKELFDLLSKAYSEMKFSVLPQLPLELAIIEWCESPQPPLLKGEKGDLSGEKPQSQEEKGITVSSLRKQVGTITKIKALYGESASNTTSSIKKEKIETRSVDLIQVPADGEITKEWQDAFWRSIIVEMKQYNHTIAGVLRGCIIRSYDNKQLIIEASYKFHKDRLDDNKTREALSKVCKMLTGKDVSIQVELKK